MVEWKFTAKGPDSSFDYYETIHRSHRISVSKIGDNRYIMYWWNGQSLSIKHSFDAADWDEAKAYAIAMIKDDISQRAKYWRDLKIGFNNWVLED